MIVNSANSVMQAPRAMYVRERDKRFYKIKQEAEG
jgi:hypothetical protein